MKKPSVRGKLRLMASGINLSDNNYVTAGLIQAQQDMYFFKLLNTAILANAILNNADKTNKLVNQALKLIYFEDEVEEVSKPNQEFLKNIRNFVYKIDPSSIPMEQDKLVRKKPS